jgi:hypothetical protein
MSMFYTGNTVWGGETCLDPSRQAKHLLTGTKLEKIVTRVSSIIPLLHWGHSSLIDLN